jgi:hypothetical protein
MRTHVVARTGARVARVAHAERTVVGGRAASRTITSPPRRDSGATAHEPCSHASTSAPQGAPSRTPAVAAGGHAWGGGVARGRCVPADPGRAVAAAEDGGGLALRGRACQRGAGERRTAARDDDGSALGEGGGRRCGERATLRARAWAGPHRWCGAARPPCARAPRRSPGGAREDPSRRGAPVGRIEGGTVGESRSQPAPRATGGPARAQGARRPPAAAGTQASASRWRDRSVAQRRRPPRGVQDCDRARRRTPRG